MRYRITFIEHTDAAGDPSESPQDFLATEIPDGVILDCTFVERAEPLAMHGSEQFEEDDDFLSIGTETWDYDVNDERADDFLAIVRSSRIAMECLPLGDDPVSE